MVAFLTGRVLDEDYWYSGLLGGGWGGCVLSSGCVLDSSCVLGVVAFLTGEDYWYSGLYLWLRWSVKCLLNPG